VFVPDGKIAAPVMLAASFGTLKAGVESTTLLVPAAAVAASANVAEIFGLAPPLEAKGAEAVTLLTAPPPPPPAPLIPLLVQIPRVAFQV
jgi:hypothetical protein